MIYGMYYPTAGDDFGYMLWTDRSFLIYRDPDDCQLYWDDWLAYYL